MCSTYTDRKYRSCVEIKFHIGHKFQTMTQAAHGQVTLKVHVSSVESSYEESDKKVRYRQEVIWSTSLLIYTLICLSVKYASDTL